MIPYYEHAGITIYVGDCLQIIPCLPLVDLIVTDPPYGMSYRSGLRRSLPMYAPVEGDNDTSVGISGVAEALRKLKAGRHLYVFGPIPLDTLALDKVTPLVWDKGRMSAGDLSIPWGAQHESLTFAVKPTGNLIRKSMRRGSVLRCPRVDGQSSQHPTEKPVRILRELIEVSSKFDEIVLDPFSGIGSTLLAAQLEGRKAIGIELEEKYCEVAAKRLQQGALDLFGEATA